jgi:hypothetical protein
MRKVSGIWPLRENLKTQVPNPKQGGTRGKEETCKRLPFDVSSFLRFFVVWDLEPEF